MFCFFIIHSLFCCVFNGNLLNQLHHFSIIENFLILSFSILPYLTNDIVEQRKINADKLENAICISDRYIDFIVCSVVVAASWLFCSSIFFKMQLFFRFDVILMSWNCRLPNHLCDFGLHYGNTRSIQHTSNAVILLNVIVLCC